MAFSFPLLKFTALPQPCDLMIFIHVQKCNKTQVTTLLQYLHFYCVRLSPLLNAFFGERRNLFFDLLKYRHGLISGQC